MLYQSTAGSAPGDLGPARLEVYQAGAANHLFRVRVCDRGYSRAAAARADTTEGRPALSGAPRLSVGLPVYNGEIYLAQSIESLLGQTYEDFELIISDNASTDATADICRSYAKQDSRIRYVRQPRNIGLAPNHNFVFAESRGELFKWAASDDLYGRDLLQRCVEALDEHPEVVLAHAWEAAIDESGTVTQALEYPLATDSPSAPQRLRSFLFGSSGTLRQPGRRHGQDRQPRHSAGRVTSTASSAPTCCGRFPRSAAITIPTGSWSASSRCAARFTSPRTGCTSGASIPTGPTTCPLPCASRCVILDPARANRLRHPTARLFGEYLWGYIAAIHRAPLSDADRRECYRQIALWCDGPRRLPHRSEAHGADRRTVLPAPERPRGVGPRGRRRPGGGDAVTPRRIRRRPVTTAPRVGLVGLFGRGQLGQRRIAGSHARLPPRRASRRDHRCPVHARPIASRNDSGCPPRACAGSRRNATPDAGVPARATKALGTTLGIGVDAYRTCTWVRRHDVVIVPGMGVLEATLPLRPWQTPYLMFLTCGSGRRVRYPRRAGQRGRQRHQATTEQAARRGRGAVRALSIVPRRRLQGRHPPDGARGVR